MCLTRAAGGGRRGGARAGFPAPAAGACPPPLALIDQRRPWPKEQPGPWEKLGVGTFPAPGPWHARASAFSGGFCRSVDGRWRLREVPRTNVPQLSLCSPGVAEAACLDVVEGATGLCPCSLEPWPFLLLLLGARRGTRFSLSPLAPEGPGTPAGREAWSGMSQPCSSPSNRFLGLPEPQFPSLQSGPNHTQMASALVCFLV